MATVEKVTLEFTNRVRLPTVVVTGAGGTSHHKGKAELDGAVVTQRLDGSLPKGRYTIAFRVVSSDGHPISGEIPFTVTRGPSPSPSPATTPEDEPGTPEPESPAESSEPAASPAEVSPTPVAGEGPEGGGGIPGWLWIAAGGLGGVGIGVFLSTRSRRT